MMEEQEDREEWDVDPVDRNTTRNSLPAYFEHRFFTFLKMHIFQLKCNIENKPGMFRRVVFRSCQGDKVVKEAKGAIL